MEQQWFYQTRTGGIQGPFSYLEMRRWHEGGYFTAELPVALEWYARWATLGELYPPPNALEWLGGATPFCDAFLNPPRHPRSEQERSYLRSVTEWRTAQRDAPDWHPEAMKQRWSYQTPAGEILGPFRYGEMRGVYQRGHLRPCTPAKLEWYAHFYLLEELYAPHRKWKRQRGWCANAFLVPPPLGHPPSEVPRAPGPTPGGAGRLLRIALLERGWEDSEVGRASLRATAARGRGGRARGAARAG